jgi:hypothetical protein
MASQGTVTHQDVVHIGVRRHSAQLFQGPDRSGIAVVAEQMLLRHPDARITMGKFGFHIEPLGEYGFPTSLEVIDGVPTVNYHCCQTEFSDIESASEHIGLALTSDARLRLEYIGKKVARWWFELRNRDGSWRTALEGGFSRVAFWRKSNIIILQNNSIGRVSDRTPAAYHAATH